MALSLHADACNLFELSFMTLSSPLSWQEGLTVVCVCKIIDHTLVLSNCSQAFASDDVVEEFEKEKSETAEKEKVKDLDFSIPGWGEWGGAGIVPSKKKKKRFV